MSLFSIIGAVVVLAAGWLGGTFYPLTIVKNWVTRKEDNTNA
jgi:hypothetical protein